MTTRLGRTNGPSQINEPKHLDSRCAASSKLPPSATEPLAPPIYAASVYRVADLDEVVSGAG